MKLNTSYNNKFKFEILIEGASSNDKFKPRLILHTDDFNLSFAGKIENGMCEFNIPKIDFDLGKRVRADIEIIHENKYFKPWTGIVDIDKQVNFKVNEVKENFSLIPKEIENQFFESKIGSTIKINKGGKTEKVLVESIVKKFNDGTSLVRVKFPSGKTQKLKLKSK